MDEAGLIRINLRERERGGIVEPGAEYDRLCDELSALLLDLRDGDTGEPIAVEAVRAYRDAPANAGGRELLPDLVVTWSGATAMTVRRLTCPLLPGFEYAVPQRLPSGRSGNHTDHGWFIARGPGVAAGEAMGEYDVVDLAPTVLHHLGVPLPDELEGRPMDLAAAR
jgi:predicted AlkP superfamily phosphohydrolase/phosphomutase